MSKKTKKSKAVNPDFENLPLTEYYKRLPTATRKVVVAPKDELLDEIAELTGRTRETVRTWCLGTITPAPHVKEKIANYFNTTPETLFPETT